MIETVENTVFGFVWVRSLLTNTYQKIFFLSLIDPQHSGPYLVKKKDMTKFISPREGTMNNILFGGAILLSQTNIQQELHFTNEYGGYFDLDFYIEFKKDYPVDLKSIQIYELFGDLPTN